MGILTDEDAIAEMLATCWAKVLDPAHPGQAIRHVNHLRGPMPFFGTLPAYQTWLEHGPDSIRAAQEEIVAHASGWSYVANSQALRELGGTNHRVAIIPQALLDAPDSPQRFWVEVHGRMFAALCHEVVYVLTAEQVEDAGHELLCYDPNLWGRGGVMVTHIGDDGNETGREFISLATEAMKHLVYIAVIHQLAGEVGLQIEPLDLPVPPAPAALA